MGVNLYDKNGYLDWNKIMRLSKKASWKIITGNRGAGKTFGCLKYMLDHYEKTGEPFMYLRRTKTQYESVCTDSTHPFKALEYAGVCGPMTAKPAAKGITAVYKCEYDDDGKPVPIGSPVCYMSALSTFSNLRGLSFEEIWAIVLDEGIGEPHEKSIRGEANITYNMYESVNRNREMGDNPRPPVQFIFMSNANDISCPLFVDLNICTKIEHMIAKHQELSIDEDRGLCIIHLSFSPISARKRHTALYKLTAKSSKDFNNMALDNLYYQDDSVLIRSEPLTEFTPYVSVAGITIYRHKSERRYYVSEHQAGTSRSDFGASTAEKERFLNNYDWLWDSFLNNRVFFQNYTCFVLFQNAFDLTK